MPEKLLNDGKVYQAVVSVDSDGNVPTGGGDASAANQQLILDVLTDVKAAYSAPHSLSDLALNTSAVLHGESTAGGGSIVRVKVNPSGTLATESTLTAGSVVIGKVGIDQTTDGTTNLVVTKNRVTTVSSGSGTITTGGTAQTAIATDANGYNYLIQNNSSSDLWFSTLATAIIGQPSIRLPAGAVYETPDSLKAVGALSVIGATTGQSFTVRKW